MFSIMTNNPWEEAEAPQVQHAIATIAIARSECEKIAAKFPKLKSEIATFAKDLEFIEGAFRADIRNYRANRAFTAVHLPALFEGISLLGQTCAAEEQSEDTIRSCLTLATVIRRKIQDQKMDEARITLESIAPDAIAEEQPEPETKGNWASRALSKVGSAGSSQIGALTSTVEKNYQAISQSTGRRLSGIGDYAMVKFDGAIDQGLSAIANPLIARANAIGSATRVALGSMALESVLIAIIFPPALPLAVGVGILEGTASYADHIEKETKKESNELRKRSQERDEKTKKALSKIKGDSPIVSLSSPHVYVTIDTDANTSNGTILSGRHIGKKIDLVPSEDLQAMIKHAPDAETKQILQAWMRKAA